MSCGSRHMINVYYTEQITRLIPRLTPKPRTAITPLFSTGGMEAVRCSATRKRLLPTKTLKYTGKNRGNSQISHVTAPLHSTLLHACAGTILGVVTTESWPFFCSAPWESIHQPHVLPESIAGRRQSKGHRHNIITDVRMLPRQNIYDNDNPHPLALCVLNKRIKHVTKKQKYINWYMRI